MAEVIQVSIGGWLSCRGGSVTRSRFFVTSRGRWMPATRSVTVRPFPSTRSSTATRRRADRSPYPPTAVPRPWENARSGPSGRASHSKSPGAPEAFTTRRASRQFPAPGHTLDADGPTGRHRQPHPSRPRPRVRRSAVQAEAFALLRLDQAEGAAGPRPGRHRVGARQAARLRCFSACCGGGRPDTRRQAPRALQ